MTPTFGRLWNAIEYHLAGRQSVLPKNSARGASGLHFQQHARRVFDRFFDADEERDGFAAVDEAVVVREGDVHHRADDDLAIRWRRGDLGWRACRGRRFAVG